MSWAEWAVVVLVAVAVALWAVWLEASRLDRLHRKVAASLATLETQLVRRATVAVELASAGLLDPVSSVLVGEAALAALDAAGRGPGPMTPVPAGLAEAVDGADVVDRGLVESELSGTLRAALDDSDEVATVRAEPGGAELVDALAAAWFRVQLARRFHNEAVAQTRRVRGKALVRGLRLAGRAPLPDPFDIDDAWPPALGRPGASAPAREV